MVLHVNAGLPVGDVTMEAGPTSAGVDSFWVTITGRGGHGAYPHKGVDPIHIAAHVILALNGIVSRRLNPFDPAVISLGSIHGGQAGNVIPNQVELSGTIRYQAADVQKQLYYGRSLTTCWGASMSNSEKKEWVQKTLGTFPPWLLAPCSGLVAESRETSESITILISTSTKDVYRSVLRFWPRQHYGSSTKAGEYQSGRETEDGLCRTHSNAL
jgi:metal-dependent amidase/aminoacylase/carboxypeptidase family protein